MASKKTSKKTATKKKPAAKKQAPAISTLELIEAPYSGIPETVSIEFTKASEVTDHTGKVTESYKAGEVLETSGASGQFWVRRLVAFVAGDERPANCLADEVETDADSMAAANTSDVVLKG